MVIACRPCVVEGRLEASVAMVAPIDSELEQWVAGGTLRWGRSSSWVPRFGSLVELADNYCCCTSSADLRVVVAADLALFGGSPSDLQNLACWGLLEFVECAARFRRGTA